MVDPGCRQAGLRVRAPAKVNLYLEVLGSRADGFHEIRTVVQAVSLCDELEFVPRPEEDVSLSCSDPDVPLDDRNLVVRAAQLMQRRFGVREGVHIRLRKRIPVGSGLGGGSSDCAITMLALRELWRLSVPPRQLAELGAELGSDVPFFFWGGAAWCEGRGEHVTPLECPGPVHYVLVMPPLAVSTARVYAGAKSGLTKRSPEGNNVAEALREGDARLLGRSLRNDLQDAALALHEELREIWSRLQELKAVRNAEGLLLSGSGSSFFVVFGGATEANRAAGIVASDLSIPCTVVQSFPAWYDSFSLLTTGRGHL